MPSCITGGTRGREKGRAGASCSLQSGGFCTQEPLHTSAKPDSSATLMNSGEGYFLTGQVTGNPFQYSLWKHSFHFFLLFLPAYFLMELVARLRFPAAEQGYYTPLLLFVSIVLGIVSACIATRWISRIDFFLYLCVNATLFLLILGIACGVIGLRHSDTWKFIPYYFPQFLTVAYMIPLYIVHFLFTYLLIRFKKQLPQ